MSTQTKPFLTEEQYLEIERHAEQRSEYLRGEIFPVEAASLRHADIGSNLFLIVGRGLDRSGCKRYSNVLRVQVATSGLYTYPDILVICGKPELSVKDRDTVTNPKVIIEILSPSTQSYDRGDKFANYRTLSSLREYLLVAQDRAYAEHWVLQSDGGWLLHEFAGPDAVIALKSINVQFSLGEAYEGVELPPTG